MIILRFALAFRAGIVTFVISARKRKRDEERKIAIAFARQFEPFSIPDYLSRREKTILDLMEQREKEEPYIITLWLGLDGLQLNDDGSTEWVSRRKADEKSVDSGLHQTLQSAIESQIKEAELRALREKLNDYKAASELANLYRMKNNFQSMNAAHEQTGYATLEYMIQTQCQNAILPAYPTYAPLFMTRNTPYWTYSAGGNFGTCKY